METYIVYFDETGDDGANTLSSKEFVLTSIFMNADSWQANYDKLKQNRKDLKEKYGLHISEEVHTKHLVRDKGLYREHNWSDEQRRNILIDLTKCIASLDIKITNVIIDKERIKNPDYNVLENALKYNIQRIENTSNGQWQYIVLTDDGRLPPMRKTARAIRVYNPIRSHFGGTNNLPIKNMIEDILPKDSAESYFIQTCDFVSFFSDLYYRIEKGDSLPKRVERVVNNRFVGQVMATLKEGEVLNLKATLNHKYGFVIYPR